MADDEEVKEEVRRFRFQHNGELFMLASEVAKSLGKPLSQLFALYPSLSRRKATIKERSILARDDICFNPVVTLIQASQYDALADTFDPSLKTMPDNPFAGIPRRTFTPRPDRGYNLATSTHTPAPDSFVSGGLNPNKLPEKPTNVLKDVYYKTGVGCFSGTGPHGTSDLVPIRLNIEQDGFKAKDAFTWNLGDKTVLPRTYALQYCHDEELPHVMASPIEHSIREQIEQYTTVAELDLGSRVATIELNIQVGATLLRDRFFWLHKEKLMTPESYAEMFCADIGVAGEFPGLVAHAIREQLLIDRKRVLQEDFGDYHRPFQIAQLKDCFRVGDEASEEWAPRLATQTWAEVERSVKEADREARRKKRTREDDMLGQGLGRDLGRRSGRARRDVSYAMPGRRGMGGGSNFRNTAVQIDVSDARAFPTDVALQSDPPSEVVRQHLDERRGVKLPADYSSKMSQKKLNVQPNAFLEALHPWRPGGRPGAAEPLPWADKKTDKKKEEPSPSEEYDGAAQEAALEMHEGQLEGLDKPGFYKDNAMNRKLGRVGQRKKSAGPRAESSAYNRWAK